MTICCFLVIFALLGALYQVRLSLSTAIITEVAAVLDPKLSKSDARIVHRSWQPLSYKKRTTAETSTSSMMMMIQRTNATSPVPVTRSGVASNRKKDNDVSDIRFFFMHIPKTGGSVLLSFVAKMVAAGASRNDGQLWCENHPAWRSAHSTFDHVCERSSKIVNLTVEQARDAFRTDSCLGLRLHYDYSFIDKVLNPVMAGSGRRLHLVTVLRDPICRLISAYFFARGPDKKMSLRDFTLLDNLETQKYGGVNHQAKQLAGILLGCSQYSQKERQLIQNDLLGIAIQRLELFDNILILEKLEDSVECLKRKYKWKGDFELLKSDPHHSRMQHDVKFSEADMQFLQETNRIDVAVYKHALHLFQERCKTPASDS